MGLPEDFRTATGRKRFVVPVDVVREEKAKQEAAAARIAYSVATNGADVYALGQLGVDAEKAVKQGQ